MIPGNANPLLLASAAAADAAAGPIKSVRFNSGDTSYLTRTPSSAGNRRTWTWSGWVKRSRFANEGGIFSTYSGSHPSTAFFFLNEDTFRFQEFESGSFNLKLDSNRVFRDPSAWYHFVVALDTTQGTASNRVKIYVNGVLLTSSDYSTATYPDQNHQTDWNNTTTQDIGRHDLILDGYIADVYFIDGSQLDCTSFGAFDDNGVWQAAAYSGTFGTNGFHLFDFANESGIGNDSSGNNNDFTVNNISLPDAGTPVSSATGAKPIFATTDSFGQTVGTGLATDDDASDLELCAPLTDGSGAASMTDRSPTGRTSSALTLTNNSSSDITVSTSTGNFYGESLNFSGSHSGVDVAGIGIWNSNFTLEGWFRRTGTGALQTLFDTWYGQTSGVGFYVWWDGTNIDVVKDGSTYYDNGSGTTLPLNTWQHIALTRNGTTIKIYVDGTQYSSFTPSDSTWTSTKLRIGDAVSNGYPFVGQIQDVRAYSGLKYTGNFTVPAKPATSANDDVLFDVPTNGTQSDTGAGGEVSSNYATFNPLANGLGGTLANGNLDLSGTSALQGRINSTIGVSSGKWYFEIDVLAKTASGAYSSLGIGQGNITDQYPGKDALSYAYHLENNNTIHNDANGPSLVANFAAGDVFMCAFDLDNNKIFFGKNGSWLGSGNPVSGANAVYTIAAGTYHVIARPNPSGYGSGTELAANFGQRSWAYSAPSGYKALCTTNLPTPTIADGSAHFDTVLYTGNGATGSRSITGLSFAPDWSWFKGRSYSISHLLYDAVRGAGSTKSLVSNGTNSEGSAGDNATFGYLESFDSSGFSIFGGSDVNNGYINANNATYASWHWNAGANSNKTYTVTVVSDSGNKYRFDGHGTSAVTLDLAEGSTYVFDQSDSSNSGHPLRFSTTSDGTHGSGSEYTTGVTATGTPGSAGAKTTIVVAASAPTLYYYCSSHSGMGGQANTNSTAGSTRLSSSENASFYNQDQDWSDGATGTTNGGADISNLFDGSLSTNVNSTWGNASHKLEYTFTALSHTTIEMYVVGQNVNNSYVKFNGVAQQNGQSSVPFGWYTVTGVTGDLTSIEVYTHSSGDFLSIYAVRVDGKILVDSDKSLSSLTQYPSINSVVKANPEAGISIVGFTAGSSGSVAHGLNAEPFAVIFKDRDTAGKWRFYHKDVGTSNTLFLNTTEAATSSSERVTAVSSSTFTVGGTISGDDYIAYCFAPVAGFSSIGSYVGNGSNDGVFVYTGHRIAWLMIKETSGADSWLIWDATRQGDNPQGPYLLAEDAQAEVDTHYLDFLSNGFKYRSSHGAMNQSGADYIYIAFASNPFSANGGLAF